MELSFWPLVYFGSSMDEFEKHNWGKAIYDFLILYVGRFKEGKVVTYLQGCLPLLEVRTKLILNKCSAHNLAKICSSFYLFILSFLTGIR